MSKWDKLIARICNLSKDLRFDELRKVMERMHREVEVVITHSEKQAVCQLRYRSMNQSRKYM